MVGVKSWGGRVKGWGGGVKGWGGGGQGVVESREGRSRG